MSAISAKVKNPVETTLLQQKELPTRKVNCLGKTIQWVRQCEKGTTFAKVAIYFLQFLASCALVLSGLGIPLFLALRKERVLQETEEKCRSLIARVQIQKDSENPLEKKLAKLKSNQSILQARNSALQERLPTLYSKKRIAEDQIAYLQPEIERETLKRNSLLSTLDGLSDSIESTNKTMNLEKKELAKEEKFHASALDELQKYKTALEKGKAVLKPIADEIAHLKDKIRNAKESCPEIQYKLIRIEELKAELEGVLLKIKANPKIVKWLEIYDSMPTHAFYDKNPGKKYLE